MTKRQQSAAMTLFEALPLETRKSMGFDRVKSITGRMLVVGWIREHLQDSAERDQRLKKKKRAEGYCGGFVTCPNWTGDERLCSRCASFEKRYQEDRKNGVPRKGGRTAYGEIRMLQRAKEREDREREGEQNKKKNGRPASRRQPMLRRVRRTDTAAE